MSTPIAAADVKLYLGKKVTSDGLPLIDALIPGAIAAIGAYCNRRFQSASYSELRNGNDSTRMQAVNYPITKVTAVVIDGVSVPPSDGYLSPGYFFSGRTIGLRHWKFCRGDRNVVLEYVAGYGDGSMPDGSDVAPWPDDLKMAMVSAVAARFMETERLGVSAKSLAGESVTYTDGSVSGGVKAAGLPAFAQSLLNSYRNVVPETGA